MTLFSNRTPLKEMPRLKFLKNPHLVDILRRPSDTTTSLELRESEILGAGYDVPIVDGIPDFVTNAPKERLSLEVEVPDNARSKIEKQTNKPADLTDVPHWFKEERVKYLYLDRSQKGLLLDVGSGQGNRDTYERMGYSYIALDVEFNSQQRCETDSDIDIMADTHRLPITSNCFSAVNSTAVIEHLYFPEIAVREWYRVLQPGGALVGSCSFLEGEHFDSQWHLSHLGLFRLLARAGFEDIHIYPGLSIWESHSNSIYFSIPFHKWLGRAHKSLYLKLVSVMSAEQDYERLVRHAAVFNFYAIKPTMK